MTYNRGDDGDGPVLRRLRPAWVGAPLLSRQGLTLLRIVFVVAGVVLASGSLGGTSPVGVGAEGLSPSGVASELQQVLGAGVVGDAQSAWPLSDPAKVARWEPGEWSYRITAGPRRGQTEREN